jgi:hypothetical protein
MPEAATVAVIDWKLLGVENPAGVAPMASTLEPAPTGSNWKPVAPNTVQLSLPGIVRGVLTIVPTAGSNSSCPRSPG